MFNVNLVTSKMKLQVASQDGSVLVAGSDHPGCPALSSPGGNIRPVNFPNLKAHVSPFEPT